jgi:3-methyladenine DNA glycosylase AlkD
MLLTAARFEAELDKHRSADEQAKILRYFKTGDGEYGAGDVFIGVRMGQVFQLAKDFIDMPAGEIEKLMDSAVHEARAGALSIMGKDAARKKTTPARLKDLFDLYVRRHDRINNWDLVDLAAANVVGRYLVDRPRDLLYELARSESLWERRTAITATAHYIKLGDLDDTYRIAEMLMADPEDLIHKATGGWLRAAGVPDLPRLLAFLDDHAAAMPRVMLRYAIEHLSPDERAHYRGSK